MLELSRYVYDGFMPQSEEDKLPRQERYQQKVDRHHQDRHSLGQFPHDRYDQRHLDRKSQADKRWFRHKIREAMLGQDLVTTSPILEELSDQARREYLAEKRAQYLEAKREQQAEMQKILKSIRRICAGSGVEIKQSFLDKKTGIMEFELNLYQIAIGKIGDLPNDANNLDTKFYYRRLEMTISYLLSDLKALTDQHAVISWIYKKPILNSYEHQYLSNSPEAVSLTFHIPTIDVEDPGLTEYDEPVWSGVNSYDDEENEQSDQAYDRWLEESREVPLDYFRIIPGGDRRITTKSKAHHNRTGTTGYKIK